MCGTKTRHRCRVRRPGLMQAASKLGVSYQHAWRVLVSGERKSPKLVARAKELGITLEAPLSTAKAKYLNSPSQDALQAHTHDAAANIAPEFVQILEKLKIERVLVRFDANPKSPIVKHPNFGEDLGAELEAAKLGYFDSSFYDPGVWMHFFHVLGIEKLGKTLNYIKSYLEKRELLAVAWIIHGEDAQTMRFYWPPHHPENQAVHVPGNEEGKA